MSRGNPPYPLIREGEITWHAMRVWEWRKKKENRERERERELNR